MPYPFFKYDSKYRDYHTYKLEDNHASTDLVFIKSYTVQKGSRMHRHQFFQINYVLRGEAKHNLIDNSFVIHSGDIFIIPPFIPHMITDAGADGCEIIEFEFAPELINQHFTDFDYASSFMDFAYVEPFLIAESNIKPRLTLRGNIRLDTELLLHEAQEEFNEAAPGYLLLIRSLLLKLLVIVGREYTKQEPDKKEQSLIHRHNRVIGEAIAYVKENYNEKLTIENIAAKFSFSPSYFSYLFKNIAPMTFSDYLISVRIEKANELLTGTDKKITEIIEITGFSDVSNFYRSFRQRTGMTPSDYRKTYNKTF